MPFAVVNRLIEEYNTNGISSVLRSDNLLDLQLSLSDNLAPLTPYQISAMRDQNLYVGDASGTKVIFYKTNSGFRAVVTTGLVESCSGVAEAAADAIPEDSFTYLSSDLCVSVSDAMKDKDFKPLYTTASKTWRGGNAGWFDQLAELAENVHGYSRSRWYNYGARIARNTSQDIAESVFKDLAKSSIGEDAVGSLEGEISATEDGDVVLGEDGKPLGTGETSSSISKLSSNLDIAASFISGASGVASVGCALVEGLVSVQTILITYQRIQKINLVSGYAEAVQRIQAGDSANSPMDEYNTRLTEKDPETGKSAMEAAGMGSLLNGSEIDQNDASVKANNPENTISTILSDKDGSLSGAEGLSAKGLAAISGLIGGANGLVKALTVCNYTTGTLAVASAAVTIASVVVNLIPVAGQIASGAIRVVQISFKAIAKSVAKGIVTALAPVVAKKIVELAGKALLKDMATEYLGEDLGNALASGGNLLLSANHQTGGGSPGDSAVLAAFKTTQATILAEEAEYQRMVRSPLDPTSRYTFLGSLAYALIPMATTTSLGGVVKSMSSLMSNSVRAVLPTASALAETNFSDSAAAEECPLLEQIGVQGDSYCNPLYVTDNSTLGAELTPTDVVNQELTWGNIIANGSGYEINRNKSDNGLLKYSLYCGQRVSAWGVPDANIAASLSENNTAEKFLAVIPIISDAKTAIDSAQSQANLPWTTGSNCVASSSNPKWSENRIHQRFIEDQRWLVNIGATESDVISTYFEEYYRENPLDNSFEGVLARYSGMTKENVIATLDLIDAINYIASYDPETRVAFGQEEPELVSFSGEPESTKSVLALEPRYIIYSDVRNRTVIV